jgi:peptide methionine sulfoxide reductase MsrB
MGTEAMGFVFENNTTCRGAGRYCTNAIGVGYHKYDIYMIFELVRAFTPGTKPSGEVRW